MTTQVSSKISSNLLFGDKKYVRGYPDIQIPRCQAKQTPLYKEAVSVTLKTNCF